MMINTGDGGDESMEKLEISDGRGWPRIDQP